MKDLPKLLVSIALCELIGLLATPFTIAAIPSWYANLQKPSFAPPNWIFGPVWTLLYILMGVSFFIIWTHHSKKKDLLRVAKQVFFIQLFLNFIWSLLFFGLHSPLLGLIDILLLWISIGITIKYFYQISKPAGYLLIPYILWVSFAAMLNGAIVVLNANIIG